LELLWIIVGVGVPERRLKIKLEVVEVVASSKHMDMRDMSDRKLVSCVMCDSSCMQKYWQVQGKLAGN
jgi:hypothetical protein